jgi:hypothetical protein
LACELRTTVVQRDGRSVMQRALMVPPTENTKSVRRWLSWVVRDGAKEAGAQQEGAAARPMFIEGSVLGKPPARVQSTCGVRSHCAGSGQGKREL